MKKTLLTALSFVFTLAMAQIPAGYYNGTSGLSGQALKNKLNDIISGHNELSYNAVKNALKNTDEDPNNSNNVILLYKGTSQSKNSFGGGANDWNREHVWAKSHGGFGNSAPEGTDLHHLRPTDASVNSSRGNKEFDDGGVAHSEATQCFYDGDSWEPRDEVKGDVARMLFYMAVRYEGESGELDLELNESVSNGSAPFHGKFSTLLQWHQDDPVDAFEQNRNNEIYGYQNNRNPFIDHPNFAQLIWAPTTSVNFTSVNTQNPIIYHLAFVQWNANVQITGGMDNIYLTYGNSATNFTDSLPMTLSGGEYKTTGVKQFNAGDQIFYRVRVKTLNGAHHYSSVKNFIVQPGIGVQKHFPFTWSMTQGIFTLHNSEGNEIIHTFNPIGQKIKSENSHEMNFQNLPKGLYIIQIQRDNNYYYLKINN
jgi:endonuclease I